MNDAELMNPENHGIESVPGVEVKPINPQWEVRLSGKYLGRVIEGEDRRFRALYALEAEHDIPTRNEAVQWILDQHKKEEK